MAASLPPATTFHPFPRLPLELQTQIFALTLPPPLLITTTFCNRTFIATSTPLPVLAALSKIQHPALAALPPILPIRLRSGKVGAASKTLYIRPDLDVLYMPFIEKQGVFSIDAMLSSPLMQKRLKQIAVNYRCIDLLHVHQEGAGLDFLRLPRGLRGLETVYVIGGCHSDSAKGQEQWGVFKARMGETWRREVEKGLERPPRLICALLRKERIVELTQRTCYWGDERTHEGFLENCECVFEGR